MQATTAPLWPQYATCSFKFGFDSFRGSAGSAAQQVALVEGFSYMGFRGPIRMRQAEAAFTVFEEYGESAVPGAGSGTGPLRRVLLGRLLGEGARGLVERFSLKRRRYIATTSMDAELALVGSNLALARPGALFYDPFVGTGSLTIACSQMGAVTLGSDMDGRAIRGSKGKNVRTSYAQYGLKGRFLDGFACDLTNSALRVAALPAHRPLLDGIVCDPPYGVREGLKVLGSAKEGDKAIKYLADGRVAHLAEGYIPPKRPYSFEALLADILEFAAQALVVEGRLSFWMPVANDEDVELGIPMHTALELVSNCVQPFNRWSRRLLTYRRKRPDQIVDEPLKVELKAPSGTTADELNSFRKRYFQGFRPADDSEAQAAQAVQGAQGD